jgi:LacI family transcriptional regulator
MSSIRHVAKNAKVSIATVSRVLNNQPGVSDAIRSRVLYAVNRCGYVANVGKRSTSFLAFAYTGPSSLGSDYDAAVFAGLGAAVDESDLDLVLVNLQREKKTLRFLYAVLP